MNKISILDILVENSGRMNFLKAIRDERKGITGKVSVAGKEFSDWDIYSLPMDDLSKIALHAGSREGPCFFLAVCE